MSGGVTATNLAVSEQPTVEHARRILCLVMPDLPCEVVLPRLHTAGNPAARKPRKLALAVVITHEARALVPTDTLDAVSEGARRFGVSAGQSIAEASIRLPQLQVRALPRAELVSALGQIAEAVLKFGVSVALQAPDTVCLDITGVAHLLGGEEALAQEAAAQVRRMGHHVRAVVANGPHIAQALARWGQLTTQLRCAWGTAAGAVRCFTAAQIDEEIARLPIAALPLQAHDDTLAWLMRCGLYSVGDLKQLPASSLTARLGPSAQAVMDFIHARDDTPLVPHRPMPNPSERFEAEEGLSGVEPLLFVLKGLAARLAARLQGRGEAASQLTLRLGLDRSIALLNGAIAEGDAPEVLCALDLPLAIARADEIERIVAARLKRLQLKAPVLSLQLEAASIGEAPALQLDFSRVLTGAHGGRQGPEVIPVLLAEIVAELGPSRAGVLREVASHLPEKKSALAPLPQSGSAARKRRPKRTPAYEAQRSFGDLLQEQRLASKVKDPSPDARELRLEPTRLFPKPLPISAKLEQGSTLVLGHTLFTVKEIQFERRLAHVEWWGEGAWRDEGVGQPKRGRKAQGVPVGISRDYWRLWLESAAEGREQAGGGCEVLAFVDVKTGQRYLQAIYD